MKAKTFDKVEKHAMQYISSTGKRKGSLVSTVKVKRAGWWHGTEATNKQVLWVIVSAVKHKCRVTSIISVTAGNTIENVDSQRGRVGTRLITFVLASYNAYAQLHIGVVYCWLLPFTSDVHGIFTIVISARAR